MSSIVRVGRQGSIILPADILQKYSIEPGDTLSLIDLNGIFVFSPKESLVPRLASTIETARLQAGLDTSELPDALLTALGWITGR